MRVFHFLSHEYGLDDIRRRRLKIASFDALNDPFELLAVNLGDSALRKAFLAMKQDLAQNRGLLCFSKDWHNPVQWGHYAESHRGVCLGFDVPDHLLAPVQYSAKRLVADIEDFANPAAVPLQFAHRLLFTKYSHWRYENEVRCFTTLSDPDPDSGLYFAEFGPDLRLAEVLVGPASTVTRDELRKALGDLAKQVRTRKTRLAFRTFRVVTQERSSLWI